MKKICFLLSLLVILSLCSCSAANIRYKCENHLKEHLEDIENEQSLKIELATIYQLDDDYACILKVILGPNKMNINFLINENGEITCENCQKDYQGNFFSDFQNIQSFGKKIYQR